MNTAVGYRSGSAVTTGDGNTLFGYHSGLNITGAGAYNVCVGTAAGEALTTGIRNTLMGQAGYGYDTENDNLAIGHAALAGQSLAGGEYNVAVGNYTLDAVTAGDANTAVGYNALTAVLDGGSLVGIGHNAGSNITTGGNSIFIGDTTQASGATVSNEIVIGYASTGKGANTGFINPNTGGVYQGNNSTTWSTTSDRRIKKNITDNNTGLEAINKIRVRNFEYRTLEEITDFDNPESAVVKKQGTQLGAIAQEIEEILPEIIKTESTGVKTLDADNLTWYLINAVQELSAKVKALEEA